MHLFDLLSKTARTHPNAEAFITEDCRCTFAQLHDTACTLALHLSAQGIRRGMRVAIVCRNGMPFVYATFALMRLGAVSVPLNWRLTPSELSAQLEHADAAWLLHDEACWHEPAIGPAAAHAVHWHQCFAPANRAGTAPTPAR